MTDEPELETGHAPTLDGIAGGLAAEAHYQSPGGRGFLLAAALLAGVPRGARVLDVGCGMGAAAIDLAEAFACRVVGFDAHDPYIAQAAQTAKARGVGGWYRCATWTPSARSPPIRGAPTTWSSAWAGC